MTRDDRLIAIEQEHVARYSKEQVDAAREALGHEPIGAELAEFYKKEQK